MGSPPFTRKGAAQFGGRVSSPQLLSKWSNFQDRSWEDKRTMGEGQGREENY
ncbi:MAG: hypothetical protein MJK14_22650 [Rivularia sp. ALOHA_DT_140]|nr:hypothetical protein [Rivularia sp. ALOHA_DT_140]